MAISRNQFLRGFDCFFLQVMPDSVIIGKGIAINVVLPIEMLNGIEIGKPYFSGSMNISSDKDQSICFRTYRKILYHIDTIPRKNPSETHCNFLNLFNLKIQFFQKMSHFFLKKRIDEKIYLNGCRMTVFIVSGLAFLGSLR